MKEIIIIKLGAKGDVIRTLPIAKALKEKFNHCKITWITKKDNEELIKKTNYIDEIVNLSYITERKFDILYNFDIDDEATKLASSINADKKFGFYSQDGFPVAFNTGAEYYLNTLFDDDLKKRNKKTYQEMMFEVAEIKGHWVHCPLILNKEDIAYSNDFINKRKINTQKLIGIHIGASSRWPSKVWDLMQLKIFIEKLMSKGYEIILFSGTEDLSRREKLLSLLNKKEKIHINDPNNTDGEFASLVNICKIIVCGDSFSLHVSLALKKKTIALFFCTSPNEIESYGLLRKVVSKKLEEFFPEKMDKFDEELVRSISPEEVLSHVEKINERRVVNAIIKKDRKLLTIKRKKSDKKHSSKWAFPGGKIEEGETIYEALIREIKEEIGLKVISISRKISEYIYDIDGIETKGQSYLVHCESENILKGEEIEDFKWATIEEIHELDCIEGLEGEAMTALFE